MTRTYPSKSIGRAPIFKMPPFHLNGRSPSTSAVMILSYACYFYDASQASIMLGSLPADIRRLLTEKCPSSPIAPRPRHAQARGTPLPRRGPTADDINDAAGISRVAFAERTAVTAVAGQRRSAPRSRWPHLHTRRRAARQLLRSRHQLTPHTTTQKHFRRRRSAALINIVSFPPRDGHEKMRVNERLQRGARRFSSRRTPGRSHASKVDSASLSRPHFSTMKSAMAGPIPSRRAPAI